MFYTQFTLITSACLFIALRTLEPAVAEVPVPVQARQAPQQRPNRVQLRRDQRVVEQQPVQAAEDDADSDDSASDAEDGARIRE